MTPRRRDAGRRKDKSANAKEPRPARSFDRRGQAALSRPQQDSNATANRIAIVAVCVVALAASLAGITNAFTQDDLSILVGSDRLHGFDHLRDVLTLPYWPPPAAPDLYRPVESILLAVQYAIGGGAPVVFRIVSYLLYMAASVGVYELASRTMPRSVAAAIAVLFAAHPIHVEAVTLAVAQNELIVGALAVLMVARYVDGRRGTGGPADSRRRKLTVLDWAFLAVCYAVAGLAKEQGLLLPVFLALAELLLIDADSFVSRLRETWRGFALLAAIGAVLVAIRTAVLSGVVGPTMVAEALRGQSMGGRFLTLLRIVPEWARLLVWPAHLRAEYSPREFVASTSFGGMEALGLAILALVFAGIWFGRRRARALSFGLGWCVIALFPVSNVVIPTGILLAERTLFLPSIGFMIAVGGVCVVGPWTVLAPRMRTSAVVAFVALAIAGIARSIERQRVWQNPTTLTLASVEDAPRSWRVQQVYGELLFSERKPAEAIAAFRRAIDLAPQPWQPRNDLAQRLRAIGDDKDAVMLLRASLAEDPRQIQTLAALPAALIGAGRYAEAKQLADSIVAAEHAPPLMVQMSRVADSAMKVNAPPGSIRIGLPPR